MANLSQKQEGGDKSNNYQAGRDLIINPTATTQAEEQDFGIIDEIFKDVIKKLDANDYKLISGHIKVKEKIEINFSNEEDRKRIQEYFKSAYTKIALIEKRIREEDPEIQNDLQGHVFGKYNILKDDGLNNMQILEGLFEQFIFAGKKNNPQYSNLTRAFILFFFDDCTIFERVSSDSLSE